MELRGGDQTQLRVSGGDLFVDHVPVPEIIFGSATLLDADNNPTPDPALHDPAAYAENTVLIATSYPAAQDNGTGQTTTFHGGDMMFRRTGGAGAEAWTWVTGSFRASNAKGEYQRFADGTQKCRGVNGSSVTTSVNAAGSIHVSTPQTQTFPAAFGSTTGLVIRPGANFKTNACWPGMPESGFSTTSFAARVWSYSSGSSAFITYEATGAWAA